MRSAWAKRFCFRYNLETQFRHNAPVAQLDRVLGYEPRGWEFDSLRAHHFFPTRRYCPDPSLRSGFRLRAPASLTPAKRLKFDSLRAHHLFSTLRYCPDPSLRSGFRLRAPASLTPAKRLKFDSLRAHHLFPDTSLFPGFSAGLKALIRTGLAPRFASPASVLACSYFLQ